MPVTLVLQAEMDIYTSNPGPLDNSVLYDQEKHVSSAVWEGRERGALRCHEHTSKLDQWTLTSKQLDLVKRAGFEYLRLIPSISLDNPLISALVERWRRETNTFHLTVGEMTVTLEDMAYLLGLAIDGEPVIGVTYTACDKVCSMFLGKAPDKGYTSGGMVKLSWLKEFFAKCPENASDEVIECHTRAYLLYLLGSTIFSTTTGNKVPVMYLQLFENFDQAGKYAWGAAALGFLYRALGNASVKTQSTISGCLTLLQCWSYYHLDIGRPKLTYEPIHDCFPLVLRWKGKQSGPTTNRDVGFYRKLFDALKPCDVEWLPYTKINTVIVPEDIINSLILGRSNTMLICFDKAERHLPERCLRQYGVPQPIPNDVKRWERKSRGVDGGIDLSVKMESELNEWLDRLNHLEVDYDGVEEGEYMQWYMNITRKFVGRPIPISSEFQKMTATLRDIAHIVDTLSTHGMDDQQLQSVTTIRYIAHECLRDQVGFCSTIMSETPSQNESGKKGKERVRRKGMGKRKRKDDIADEYYEPSDDYDQSDYCVLTVDSEVGDHSHLSYDDINNKLIHATITIADSRISQPSVESSDTHLFTVKEDDDSKIVNMGQEVDDSQLCHTFSIADDSGVSQTANHVDDLKLGQVALCENGDMELCENGDVGGLRENDNSKFVNMVQEVDDSQLCHTFSIADDSGVAHTTNQVDDHVALCENDDVELCVTSDQADQSQLCDTVKHVDEVNEANYLQHCHKATQVDDSQLSHSASVNDPQPSNASQDVSKSAL